MLNIFFVDFVTIDLLHKRPASHPLNGPNGLIFPAKDRAELMADFLELQFSTNPGPDIPEVTANYISR
jgi:hypothetical protein